MAVLACGKFGSLIPNQFQRSLLFITRRLPSGWIPVRFGYLVRKLGLRSLGESVDVTVYGQKMRLHPHDNLCEKRVLFMPQLFDTAERSALVEHMHEPFTFIDIGANAGIYSLFVAGKAGRNAKIVACEPDPLMFDRLQFNLETNQLNTVHAAPVALGDQIGRSQLFINRKNRGKNSLMEEEGEAVEVDSTTLLKLLDDYEITRPDAIKIDVEGAELLVLEKFFAEASTERFPNLWIIENPRKGGLSRAAQLVLDNGYRLRDRTRMNVLLERV